MRTAAQHFLAQEERLDALINNAAIQALKDTKGETKTAQGHEMHLGVNVLGPFLFTRLLTPILKATASKPGTGKGAVRVVWVSSMGTETIGEKSRGLSPDYVDYWPLMSPLERYGLSKAGNWLHGVEFARRHATDGIMSVPVNPGHLSTELYREAGFVFRAALKAMALYPPVYGAYVELFGAVSSDLTMKDSGSWGTCRFRFGSQPALVNVADLFLPQLFLGGVCTRYVRTCLRRLGQKRKVVMGTLPSFGTGVRSKSRSFYNLQNSRLKW